MEKRDEAEQKQSGKVTMRCSGVLDTESPVQQLNSSKSEMTDSWGNELLITETIQAKAEWPSIRDPEVYRVSIFCFKWGERSEDALGSKTKLLTSLVCRYHILFCWMSQCLNSSYAHSSFENQTNKRNCSELFKMQLNT